MEVNYDNLKATELTLGLPGRNGVEFEVTLIKNKNNKKRSSSEVSQDSSSVCNARNDTESVPPPSKAQVVGWPPIRSYRKNNMLVVKNASYVKVSMDGGAYLRKIDIKNYKCYSDLVMALEEMFKLRIGEYSEREGYNGSDYTPTYQDKDGDWMLVGDVPWNMFINSCKRLRIMRGSEARGLGSS